MDGDLQAHEPLMSISRSLKPPRLDDAREEDEKGIMESVNKVHALVAEEAKHVPSERIVVGGFSQGAALSLLVSLTTDKKVRLSNVDYTCPLTNVPVVK